jgi:hypothetical protein
VKHPGQRTGGVRPAGEPENIDPVALLVIARQPGVGLFKVVLDAVAGDEARDPVSALPIRVTAPRAPIVPTPGS